MDFYKEIEGIKEKLNSKGYTEYANEITNRVRAGSTGGEIMSGVASYLKHLDEVSKDAFKLIKKETDFIVSQLAKNGLIIK